MAISRRRLIASTAAGSALAAAATGELLAATAAPAAAASPVGDVVGKITVGYQGWFAAIGDGSPLNGWWHWANNWGQPPSPGNNSIVSWPDMRDYPTSYQTAFNNLNSGQPAKLFSHFDQSTVNIHFQWMQQYGCDTAALQRFNPTGGEGPIRDAMTAKVRTAAEASGRKFYIMYDVTNWTNMQSEIKADWTNKMSAYTSSTAYARQNGKPVVCIWGFGFNDAGRPFAPAPCLDVINWFKAQGCYVIGGVPTYWRQGINDSRAGYFDVYTAFHMISPWMVGRTGDVAGLDWFYNNVNLADQAECNSRGIDYQPCVMPGDLSSHARAHGDFYWRHFYNMIRLGCQGIYISMFDEYNEGNQIAKTAENASMIPAGTSFVTLDEDGTVCSSDYYLRITADGGKMLKGQLALTATRPTQPVVGGQPPVDSDLARGKTTSASSSNGGFGTGNAVDGNQATYWESANGTFPQWLQVDLGAASTVSRVVLKLPTGWGQRYQTLSVQGSTDGGTFTTLVNSAQYSFDPGQANTVTVAVPTTTTRYVRINITANTGWTAAQVSTLEVYGTAPQGDTQAPSAPANLRVTGQTSNSVSLAWNAATDNVGVTGYQIRQNGAVVASTAATSLTVTGLNPSTTYSYTVAAQDAAGNVSGQSNTVSATTSAAPNTNLAKSKPTTASSYVQNYVPQNATDGDPNTYWESVNNAFPQWIQVDLQAATSISRIVLKVPPPAAWGQRTQTIAIQASNDGTTWTTLVAQAGFVFNPATGNQVTMTFTAGARRYVRAYFYGNTGWPAAQLSEYEIYAS
ncbi:hypothetical protein Cs7R123_52080 [Catellatospora sp. TT07R-123]|uniref:galactose-binding domain-containing protein n=1 Tax=Catellatospora sp. TT07R-123 TaxID=2733863 RepID=UPI001B1BDA55|nr:discoidin domain-containing protein [Catellatospora sp. TT07R-123]GHJ47866.1 hypothetical protein Cs7R123_52080 [Catellatospora sp. TT07R-123]